MAGRVLHITVLLLGLSALLLPLCSGQCTYPSDLDGTFYSSHETDAALTWNSTHVSPFTYVASLTYTVVYECHWTDGTYYISRSAKTVRIVSTDYYFYTCWKFTRLSANKYIYGILTSQYDFVSNERVKLETTTFTVSAYTDVCDDVNRTRGEYSFLLKDGTADQEKIQCPDPLLATGVYTMTSETAATYCNDVSQIDACTTTGVVSVNYTTCSAEMFYSTTGTVYCMYSTGYASDSDTSSYYVTMWNTDANPDQSSQYYYTCVAVTSSVTDGLIHFTTYPQECLSSANQNATMVTTSGTPKSGYSVVVNATTTCVPVITTTTVATTTTTTGAPVPGPGEDNTYLIVGIVVGLLVLIGLAVGIGFIIYHFIYKKSEGSKIVPDTIPNTAMSQADRNKKMMFTPAPPRSAGPGGRQQEYYDERTGSDLSMRPTVSQLANYRTPTPFISDSKVENGNIAEETTEPHTKYTMETANGTKPEADSGALEEQPDLEAGGNMPPNTPEVDETPLSVTRNVSPTSRPNTAIMPINSVTRPSTSVVFRDTSGLPEVEPDAGDSSVDPKTSLDLSLLREVSISDNTAAQFTPQENQVETNPAPKPSDMTYPDGFRDDVVSATAVTATMTIAGVTASEGPKSKSAKGPTKKKRGKSKKSKNKASNKEEKKARETDPETADTEEEPVRAQTAAEGVRRVSLKEEKTVLPKKKAKKLEPFFMPDNTVSPENIKDFDVDSILDFDVKRLGEPDGAESGVVVDMEGSLPVFSDSGDLTPEPTRVTPRGKLPRRPKPTPRDEPL